MTLLEAISPTSRDLLSGASAPMARGGLTAESGGGIVNINIVKCTKTGQHRVHSSNANGAPHCGGGNSARSAQWQTTIEEPNCKRCATILQRRSALSLSKGPVEQIKPNRKATNGTSSQTTPAS